MTVSFFKSRLESEMRTASRREHRFVQNGHAAQARARWHVRSGHAGLGRCTKNICFSQVSVGMCTERRRELIFQNAHRAEARAPRRVPGVPARVAADKKVLSFITRDVRETHRASTGEPCGGPSLVNITRSAPARGVARKATAGGLMPAAHSRAQRNEFNLHLDSAGHRFGSKAHGGSRRRILSAREKCGNVARK